jgi:translation elongation factor EF-Ts
MDAFLELSRDLAMHIAASNPDSVATLLQQPFVKDQSYTVREHLTRASKHLEDKVEIIRFIRWDHSPGDSEIEPPPKRPAVVMRVA